MFNVKTKKTPSRQNRTPLSISDSVRRYQRKIRDTFQDIGELPAIVNPKRKAKAGKSLLFFCQTYFAEAFYLKFSPTHINLIKQVQAIAEGGGCKAVAMPRGSGKTTLMQVAALWSLLYGYRRFTVIVASNADRAGELMKDIKVWLETNELLFEDFPEVCHPVRKLERTTHRQRGQKYQGEPTRIDWSGNKIVFPTIAGSISSGSVMTASGMTGSDIRGQKSTTADSKILRPDLVLIDDPQTRETAASPTQCHKRERIISGDVLGMAGPGKTISAFLTCTVIQEADLADRLLDRGLHPEWQGERTQMLIEEPANAKLWEEYGQVRADELRNEGDGSVANQFYIDNRKRLDEGALVYWDERFNPNEISAIQSAMNLKLTDATMFASEYQNKPLQDVDVEDMLTIDEVMSKHNGLRKGVVPSGAQHITAFIDIQKDVLFYSVCGWSDDFTGYIIDYGTFPDQKTRDIDLNKLKPTIRDTYKRVAYEAALNTALSDLAEILCAKDYTTEMGQLMRIKLCLIDASWGESTDVVYSVCQRSPHANVLMPYHGVAVGATSKPFSEYKRKRGERVGFHWRVPALVGKRAIRHVLNDVNFWKSFVHQRLDLAPLDKSSLSFYGNNGEAHRFLAMHLLAETKTLVSAKGREVMEWKIRPHKPRNDWLDCVVGCACAASICGAKLDGVANTETRRKRKKVSLRELQERQRQYGNR